MAVAAVAGLVGGCGSTTEAKADSPEASEQEFAFTGALDFDCSHGGRNPNDVEVFIVSCPRDSVSPDGAWRLVTEDSIDDAYVFIDDISGRRVGPVPGLSDGMPFAMIWSPRPGWFFVDHHAGSFMQRPEVFEITPGGVIARNSFVLAGQAVARKRFPCLPDLDRPWANGNLMGWSRDGRLLAWVLVTRIDVCMDADQEGAVRDDQVVHPVLMISDLDSGEVVDGSVIVLDDQEGDGFELPDSGPYREIVTADRLTGDD